MEDPARSLAAQADSIPVVRSFRYLVKFLVLRGLLSFHYFVAMRNVALIQVWSDPSTTGPLWVSVSSHGPREYRGGIGSVPTSGRPTSVKAGEEKYMWSMVSGDRAETETETRARMGHRTT